MAIEKTRWTRLKIEIIARLHMQELEETYISRNGVYARLITRDIAFFCYEHKNSVIPTKVSVSISRCFRNLKAQKIIDFVRWSRGETVRSIKLAKMGKIAVKFNKKIRSRIDELSIK